MSWDCGSCYCDDCGVEIDDGEAVYCEDCRDGIQLNKHIPREECARCHRTFNRTAMIAKIAGTMCWKCAHAHEIELLKSMEVTA